MKLLKWFRERKKKEEAKAEFYVCRTCEKRDFRWLKVAQGFLPLRIVTGLQYEVCFNQNHELDPIHADVKFFNETQEYFDGVEYQEWTEGRISL